MSEGLPKRLLGRTGIEVSILALGGVKYNQLPDAEAAAVVHRAIDLGINYIDTAATYDQSEWKLGPVVAERRDEVFLASKSRCRDHDGVAADIESSLKRLRTDRIDVYQIHQLETAEDWGRCTGMDGALKALEEARDGGAIRFIGVTGHTDPDVLALALREYPLDTVLASLGPMHAAERPFLDTVVSAAEGRGAGVLAMKALAYSWLADRPEPALRFTMNQPGVAAAVVGMESIEQVEQNVAIARDARPLADAERDELLSLASGRYNDRPKEAWFIHK